MNIRESIENSPVVWFLGTLLTGFLSGFAAYQTTLEYTDRTVISNKEYEAGKEAVELVDKLSLEEGPRPPGYHSNISSTVDGESSTIRLDDDFRVNTKWIGILGKKYYNQEWYIYNAHNKLVAKEWHPFIRKFDGDEPVWANFRLSSEHNEPGEYRVEVYLNQDSNNEKPIYSENITVVSKAEEKVD